MQMRSPPGLKNIDHEVGVDHLSEVRYSLIVCAVGVHTLYIGEGVERFFLCTPSPVYSLATQDDNSADGLPDSFGNVLCSCSLLSLPRRALPLFQRCLASKNMTCLAGATI